MPKNADFRTLEDFGRRFRSAHCAIMKRPVGDLLPLLISLLLTACRAAAQTETLPNSPVPTSVGTLNLIAVGIAVVGGIVGMLLAIRRRYADEEPEADAEHRQKKRKKTLQK